MDRLMQLRPELRWYRFKEVLKEGLQAQCLEACSVEIRTNKQLQELDLGLMMSIRKAFCQILKAFSDQYLIKEELGEEDWQEDLLWS